MIRQLATRSLAAMVGALIGGAAMGQVLEELRNNFV